MVVVQRTQIRGRPIQRRERPLLTVAAIVRRSLNAAASWASAGCPRPTVVFTGCEPSIRDSQRQAHLITLRRCDRCHDIAGHESELQTLRDAKEETGRKT